MMRPLGSNASRGFAWRRLSSTIYRIVDPVAQSRQRRTMPVPLYLDVHVDKAIHDPLKLRGVEVFGPR
jgi:hypothetical protein